MQNIYHKLFPDSLFVGIKNRHISGLITAAGLWHNYEPASPALQPDL